MKIKTKILLNLNLLSLVVVDDLISIVLTYFVVVSINAYKKGIFYEPEIKNSNSLS
ncbi:hypothetical protein [Romboutsia lituseburensis]|uniref:hypothetical protein n=1 Tax=Romboutsia lituseburensis TaxID=1537 RepID=UPI0022EA66F9|nr:hypothetical protein [Romboutsia lituseburensis]